MFTLKAIKVKIKRKNNQLNTNVEIENEKELFLRQFKNIKRTPGTVCRPQ